MHHPDQRDCECEFRGIRDTADAKVRVGEREEQQRVEDMDCDVDEAISADVQLAECVVDCERQADDRPSGQGRSSLRLVIATVDM
jgi:hypothetical protein